MPNFVQLYKSTDTNAPTLSGTAGSLIALLNQVLVNGYTTTASISALSQVGNLATATITANTTLVTGNYLTISGANESAYNGTFQITVLSSTQFTFTVVGDPTSPATGTIVYKKAGLGWSSPFTATNVAVYRSNDNSSNRFYLRLDETGSTAGGQKECKATLYETMTDANTGTQQTPVSGMVGGGVPGTNGGVCWAKSITADATTRSWAVIGDDKTFYLQVANGTNTWIYGFGHFIPTKAGDGFNTFIAGMSAFNAVTGAISCGIGTISSLAMCSTTVSNHLYLPRSYIQNGGPVSVQAVTINAGSSPSQAFYAMNSSATAYIAPQGFSFPNPSDQMVYFVPVLIVDCTTVSVNLRGRFPGFFSTWHRAATPFQNYDQVNGIVNGLTTTSVVCLTASGYSGGTSAVQTGQGFFDYVGPWT